MKVAADAALLLRSGRASMALTLLEALPAALEAELARVTANAYDRGHADGRHVEASARQRKTLQKRPPPTSAPRRLTRLDWLRSMVAEPAQRERVRSILRLDDRILDRVLDGRAQLSETSWRALKVLR